MISSTYDLGGGAEISAWNLFASFREHGHDACLAVGGKRSDDPNVFLIPNNAQRHLWARLWLGLAWRLEDVFRDRRKINFFNACARAMGEPVRWLEGELGREDFDYPGTRHLFELCGRPDILHCYNLHGGYFDLRLLPWLSRQVPVILDLRDAWLLSGHCAHSFDCERWKIGCGNCPDLSIYPSIRRDATAYNWQQKRAIYAKCRLYVCTPCEWLMERAKESILLPAVIESRVIPTGVDQSIFHPGSKAAARAALDLPQDARILLFTANGIRRNLWKDYATLRTAVGKLAARLRGRKTLFLALGEDSAPERVGNAEVRFIPFQRESTTVANYYRAADVYVHAARAETFPRAVLEALSCGTPVVATAVGGIREQIRGFRLGGNPDEEINTDPYNRATGALISPRDPEAMAVAIEAILKQDSLRDRLSENAAKDAQMRFSHRRQVSEYLRWYQEILHKDALNRGIKAIAH